MLKKIYNNFMNKGSKKNIKNDASSMYKDIIVKINAIDLKGFSDIQLQAISRDLMDKARGGIDTGRLLVIAYALVKEASIRVLHMSPFDVQIAAGIALYQGAVIDMKTGEGKTLAAVFPAYLNALKGKGVHVLTFNDYLAKRDAQWKGPLYRFLGLRVGYVQEGMPPEERRKAYECDITYATAREIGFDFLRSFMCMKKSELVLRGFNCAIIDEADSILIDEARIPLVLAGDVPLHEQETAKITDTVKKLKPGLHYETDEYQRNVFLTDKGLEFVESELKCKNLYEEESYHLLLGVNNALHAEILFKKDVDYIVRDGKIELVDEFTGRVADKRKWPDGLQAAIEAKEGLDNNQQGRVLYSITMQNFVRQYSKLSGMTGTALSATEQFLEFYGLNVISIPTNRPCIRLDYGDEVYTHIEAKFNALVREIIKIHSTGRPILIGTCSVNESERLAGELMKRGVHLNVLNAKNDELEAGIIKEAGKLYAVTVSTNMAGRGTDIRLGGESGEGRQRIIELGGLYVIGTNRHESIRIDNQLRGRAGRQGDPGSSRFFVSLEDPLLKRYGIDGLIPEKYFPKKQDEPLENRVISREIARAQRIVDGQNFDIRKTLHKYSYIMEHQRKLIHKRRQNILENEFTPGLFGKRLKNRYTGLTGEYGKALIDKVERQVSLYHINKCWSEYLSYVSYIRESIHLCHIGGKNPMDEFHRTVIKAFTDLINTIDENIVETLGNAQFTGEGIDMEKEGLKAPSSTWTYTVDDRAEQLGISPILANPAAIAVNAPLYLLLALNKFFNRKKK